MAIVLGPHQYGKAEIRLVRIRRDVPRHEIRDLSVSTALQGDFAAAHLTGDQSQVLPTDSQKNFCYAYAKQHGIGPIEDYAVGLARRFADEIAPVCSARVQVEEYTWERITISGAGHDHAWARRGAEVRTTVVTAEGSGTGQRTWVVSGLKDLVLLKSTGSEFWGFLKDEYTTLAETRDRVLATSLTARWRYADGGVPWDAVYADVRRLLMERFAQVHSFALQQTLWEMGKAALAAHPEIAEMRLSAPNRHHFLVDLAPFGLSNDGEVFHADDRPYGLIECTVARDDASDPGPAWEAITGLA
jgi:urate oxidase